MILLANMSVLAKRCVSSGRHDRSAPIKQPFVAERSAQAGDTLSAIYALLERALSAKHGPEASEPEGSPGNRPDEPLPEGDEDTATAALAAPLAGSRASNAESFVVSSLLQILTANVQHLIQVLSCHSCHRSCDQSEREVLFPLTNWLPNVGTLA
jgi:hypothetical protein